MWSNCFPFLALLLYNSYLGNSISISQNESINSDRQNETNNKTDDKSVQKRTTLIDLNDDCLYLIFDRLDLLGLVNVASINPKFAYISANIFRQKVSKYEIKIVRTKWSDVQYDINKTFNYITINDLEMFSNLMKYFGNVIHDLTIWNNPVYNYTLGSDWAVANQIVNEYGSESLTQLKMGIISNEMWPHISLPFKNIEKLKIEMESDIDGMKLNQLFPKLHDLRIRLSNAANYDVIDCELPHLKHLSIMFDTDTVWNRNQSIIGLIQKNPQIRSVSATATVPAFTKVINEFLPNLENISLSYNDDLDEPLHFEHVNHCFLVTHSYSTMKNLSFSHLESLEIVMYLPHSYEKFAEFFQRHGHLKRLHFKRIWGPTVQLDQLMKHLHNIGEVIVRHSESNLNIEDVIKFIENHSKLMKFQLPEKRISEADREILRERFDHDWHIKSFADEINTYDEIDVLLFERKMEL